MVYGLSTDPLQALKGLKQKGATTTTSTPNFTTIKGKTETTPTVGLKPKQLAEIGGYAGGFAGITKPTIGTPFGAPAGAEKTAMVNMPQEVQKRIVQDVQNKSALPGTQGLEQKAGIDTTEPQFMETNVEGQITEQSPVQLYADLKAGMPISEASKYYPEYAANLATINQLKADIDAGMPEAMIPQYYPELYPQVAEEQQRGGGVKGAAAAFSPIDLGPTGETLINPVGRVAEIIDNQVQRLGSFDFTKTAEENLDKRVANLTQKELEKYQKEREKYKKDNPGLAKQYTKSVEGKNLLAQMWNIVTGDTKDTDEVEAFKAFVRQREKKFVEELAGADTKGPHMANIIANAPGSALKTVSAIGRAVLNPADTLAGLGKIIFTAEGRKAITDRYGSREAFAKTLETDPIGVASDVLAVVEGGAGIVKTGAKVTSRIAERAGALETAAKAGRVAEKAGEFGKVTGISSDLGLRQVLPYQLGRAVKAVENVPVVGKIAKYGQAMTTPLDTFVSVAKPIAGKVLPTAEETLQRMNRMTAGDQRKFLKENKQTVGQFINKEYGAVSPREAVEKALNTVNENKNQVNQAVEQIQGPQRFEAVEYTDADGNKLKYDGDAISDMADMGIERASNTNSPLKKLFVDFKDKYKAGTATMTDINKIQRTFQANVGMAYFKDIAAGDKKAKATNIDSAVRERKMKKGIDYGFTNFREINRNTKAHMAIVKGLEKRDAGRAANNAVSLTDWIMFAPAMIEPTHLSGIIAKKIIQSNRFAKNYVRILNKLNGHTIAAQRVADLKTISKINSEIELNKRLMGEETKRLATTGLPSPKTVTPSKMGTPEQPIPLKGKIGEEVVMTGRRRNTVGQTDAPEIGDETKLGKVVAVTHTGGGFPRYSVKIEGYRDFMPVEKIEGGIYEGTKESKATTKAAEVMPREEAPTERAPTDELAELGEKRKYYAQAMVEELGFDKIEDIEDVEIRNEIARILRMKNADKVDEAFAALKEKVDAMEQEKSDKLDAYLEKKAIERETGVIPEEPKKTEEIPLSPKPMKNASSDMSSNSVPANTTPIGRKTTNVKGPEESTTAGGHARPARGADVEAKKPMKTKAQAKKEAKDAIFAEQVKKANEPYEEHNRSVNKKRFGVEEPTQTHKDFRDMAHFGSEEHVKLPEYDAEVYSVKELTDPMDNKQVWKIKIGMKESLGEQGGYFKTILRHQEPTLENVKSWLDEEIGKPETVPMKTKTEASKPVVTYSRGRNVYDEPTYFKETVQNGIRVKKELSLEGGDGEEIKIAKEYLDNLEKGTSTGKVAKKEYNTNENLSTKTPKNDGPELQTKQGGTAGSSDEIVKVSLFEEKTGTEPRAKGEDTGSELKGGHIGDTTSAGTGYGAGRPISKSQQGAINKEVIQLLKDKEFSTNPKDYTPEEYEKLKQYEGGGGVTKEEGDFSGANDEFYTPDKIIDDMRYLAKKYGYKDGATVLEPSAGIGRVISRKPMRVDKATGLEIDKTSGTIAKILNPDAEIKIGDYQDNFMDFTRTRALSNAEIEKLPKYDIVIGNPPYKERTTKQRNLGDLGKINRFEDYFMIRGLDQLKPDGTMVVIVPSSFMDKPNYYAKVMMNERGRLVDAYRLPNKAFPNTDVGTDILVFKKGTIDLSDKLEQSQLMQHGEFFKRHPEKVFGEEGTRMGRFGEEKYVKGTMEDVKIQTQTPKELIDERVKAASKKIAEQETKGMKPKAIVGMEAIGKESLDELTAKTEKLVDSMGITDAYVLMKNNLKKASTEARKANIEKSMEIIKGIAERQMDEYNPQRTKNLTGTMQNPDNPTVPGYPLLSKKDWELQEEIYGSFNKKKKPTEIKIDGKPAILETTKVPEYKPAQQGLFDVPTKAEEAKIADEIVSPKEAVVNKKAVPMKKKGETKVETKPIEETETRVFNHENIHPSILKETLDYQEKTNVFGEVEGVHYTKNPQLLNYMDGKTFLNYEYFSGDIFQKLDQLEIDKPMITEAQYQKQRQGLMDRLPEQQVIENVNFSAIENPQLLNMDTGELQTKYEYVYDPQTKKGENIEKSVPLTIKEKFKAALREDLLPNRSRVSANEIIGYIDGRKVDKDRSAMIKEDTEYYFNKFIKEGLTADLQKKIIDGHNRRNRSVVPIDTTQIPIVIKNMSKTFRGKVLKLKDVQIQGILKATNKGAYIIAHGVGYGKTMEGVVATVSNMQKGISKRPVFIVPGQTMEGRKETIKALFPTYKVNELGTLDVKTRTKLEKERGTDKSKWIADNTITIMTHSAFENQIAFKTATQNKIGGEFMDDMMTEDMSRKQMEALYEKNEATVGAVATTKAKTGGDFSMYDKDFITEQYAKIENMGQDEFVKQFVEADKTKNPLSKMKAQEMYAMKPIYMEDLGFDAITVDEMHNFKNVFSKAKIEEGNKNMFGDVQGSTSKRGMKMAIATNYILANNNGRGVLGLTATPFNNQAIEVYNILNFVARARLKKLGITNMNEFMSMFSDFQEQLVVRPSGTDVSYRSIQKNFKNLQDLQRLVNEFIDYKGDSPEIVKPVLKNITVKLQMSELQKRVQMEIENRIDENVEKGDVIGGQQEARANVVSPYFTNRAGAMPTAADFMRNSPKIDFFADMLIEKRKLGNTDGAILFMPQGVPFHELTREGIALRTGIPIEKIGIINGEAKYKKKMVETANKFNSGELEVLIGGDNINEGIDLQHRTVMMYDTLLGRNPTVTTQKTGRAWRQGNLRNMVAMVTPLMENSVDSVMMQKMEEKQSRINDIFSAEGEVFSVEDIDPAEEKLALMTDPAKKAKIAINIEAKKLQRTAEGLKGDISELERHKANLEAEMNTIPNMLRTIDEYKGRNTNGQWDEFIKRYEKDIASLQGKADRSRERIKKNNINIEADLVLNRAELEKVEKEIKELSDTMPARVREYTEQQQAEIANRKDRRHYLDQVNDVVKNVKVFKDVEEQAAYLKGVPHKK